MKSSLRGLEPYSFASVRVLFVLIHSLVLPGRTSSCLERAVQPPFEVEVVSFYGWYCLWSEPLQFRENVFSVSMQLYQRSGVVMMRIWV